MEEGEKNKKISDTVKREEKIRAFWEKERIFEKSLEKPSPRGEFVFYDGPPFATGLPHYGHLLAGTIKDIIPRYKTMRGYYVRRRWGWDCHGLPLENLVEKELGLATKKDIEKYGIEKFNETARDAVLRYADDWKEIIPRTGRWVDMEHDYRTMDTEYTESIWWAFKELDAKDLMYQSFKSMHICPRCGTSLSNFEVAQGYKDITDLAVTTKFELTDEPGTYLLAWTTTPWTLPGNTAVAVSPEATYVKVRVRDEYYIVAQERVGEVFKDTHYSVEETLLGRALLGRSYTPPFDYFIDKELEHKENAWKVYGAPYVSVDEGTGIVHIAPAFGAEDLELAQKNGVPLVHHVGEDGSFVREVTDFADMVVKPKDDPTQADVAIIKYLAHKGQLFAKEKIAHAYPHCWRCDTPLLNYATTSWFVKVQDVKDKMVRANTHVGWVPETLGNARFHKLLETAPDWAISRSRYWGAPIPVWQCTDCTNKKTIGSINELAGETDTSGNTYFVMRHGESVSNTTLSVNYEEGEHDPLTELGKHQVEEVLARMHSGDFDIIITSPLERTRETAEMIRKHLGLEKKQFLTDERIAEFNVGTFQGRTWVEYGAVYTLEEQFSKVAQEHGETRMDVKRRTGDFLYDIERRFENKKILIVTHNIVASLLFAVAQAADHDGTLTVMSQMKFENATLKKLDFVPLPHDNNYTLDLHRPYIDEVKLACRCGGSMERIPEVFDCWFESGSMPYAQFHYPFENTDIFQPKKGLFHRQHGFPADFIAEGVDQTRGWFYSLLVLGVALFGESPYKHVIVNGTILAEDGQKMSKRLKNYPDPLDVINTYGADALRYYLAASPAVRGEDMNFSEEGVAEVMRKVVLRLDNVVRFFETYAGEESNKVESQTREHILDTWIISRLHELTQEVTSGLERYELDNAARPLADFVDDLSTWYLRRSRERFKSGDERAVATTRFVLRELAKLLAPFMPFLSEDIYARAQGGQESVHLDSWPEGGEVDEELLAGMEEVRRVASRALEARSTVGIKVRQPLASLTVRNPAPVLVAREDLQQLILDEVNVKEIHFEEATGWDVELDTELTPELIAEGRARELTRAIQNLRKKRDFSPHDEIALTFATNDEGKKVVEQFKDDIASTVLARDISFAEQAGEEVVVDDIVFIVTLTKA